MNWSTMRVALSRIVAMFRRTRNEDLDAEITTHLDLLAAEHEKRGLPPAAARAAARRDFGGVGQMKETYRSQRGLPFVDVFSQDVRSTVRAFRRSPAFTLATVLTLSLGIGATTAIFSVADAVLLRPLPYQGINRVLALGPELFQSGEVFHYLKSRMTAFDHVAASRGGYGWNFVAGERAEFLRGAGVSSGYFAALGAAPFRGREFTQAEDQANGPRAVILSHLVWQRHFGERDDAIGWVVRLGGVSHTVVGVLPAGFHSIPAADVWTPLRLSPRDSSLNYSVIGRLADHEGAASADRQLEALKAPMMRDLPSTARSRQRTAALRWLPYQEVVSQNSRRPLILLLGAVVCVLAISCANVAGLQLVRAVARRREIATRCALGGGTSRAIAQVLTESLLIGALGALGGLFFASVCLRAALPLVGERFLVGQTVAIDWRVLGLTAGVSLAAAALVGLWPVVEVVRLDVRSVLADGGGRVAGSQTTSLMRRALVMTEVALACVLLASAGLFGRALVTLTSAELGFDPRGVLTAQMSVEAGETPGGRPLFEFYEETLQRLRSVAGVESVAVGMSPPVSRGWNMPIEPAGRVDGMRSIDWQAVTAQYFAVFQIPIRAGRTFNERDSAAAPRVAIVNEVLAQTYFGSADAALGQTIQLARTLKDPLREIVGVVGNVKAASGSGWTRGHALAAPATPSVYFPTAQAPAAAAAMLPPAMFWMLRGRGGAASFIPDVQRVVRDAAPLLPIAHFATMDDVIHDSLEMQRVFLLLLSVFAAIAVALTAAGIFGLVAYSVGQRTREIGIRMALGATPANMLRRFIGEGAALAAAGAAIGFGLSAALTRFLTSMFFVLGVDSRDSMTLAAAAFLLVLVAGVAAFVPASRAAHVDPMLALRYE